MDVGTLNDIGITLAGVIGVALFYFIGKKSFDKDQRRAVSYTHLTLPTNREV